MVVGCVRAQPHGQGQAAGSRAVQRPAGELTAALSAAAVH